MEGKKTQSPMTDKEGKSRAYQELGWFPWSCQDALFPVESLYDAFKQG